MAFFLPILILLAGPTPDTIRERKEKKKTGEFRSCWTPNSIDSMTKRWYLGNRVKLTWRTRTTTERHLNCWAGPGISSFEREITGVDRVWADPTLPDPTDILSKNSVAGIHQCGRWVISGVRATDNDKSLSLGTREEASELLIISSSSSPCAHKWLGPSLMPSSNFEPLLAGYWENIRLSTWL
jgi:hypothetical protein